MTAPSPGIDAAALDRVVRGFPLMLSAARRAARDPADFVLRLSAEAWIEWSAPLIIAEYRRIVSEKVAP